MTLQEAKDKVAYRLGYINWHDYMLRYQCENVVVDCDEAAELYAQSLQSDAWDSGFDAGTQYSLGLEEPANPYKPKG